MRKRKMIDSEEFAKEISNQGFTFYVGKPSPNNANLFNTFDLRFSLVKANSTAEAMSIAAGASFNKQRPCIILDEKTLLSSMNVIEELILPYNAPFLGLLVTNEEEEILHRHIDENLLLHKIKTVKIVNNISLKEQISDAKTYIKNTEKPLILILEQKDFLETPIKDIELHASKLPLVIRKNKGKERCKSADCITSILHQCTKNTVVVTADPGVTNVLSTFSARVNQINFSSPDVNPAAFAFGLALTSNNNIVLIDTPNTVLSNLASLSTIGHYRPKQFMHIILDSKRNTSTGGQLTITNTIDLAALAQSLCYELAYSMDSEPDVEKAMQSFFLNPETTLIHLKVKPEENNRTIEKTPPLEQKEAFQKWQSDNTENKNKG